MEATEIRIGNYYYWMDKNEQSTMQVYLSDFCDLYEGQDKIERWIPIDIDKTWLEKFGFEITYESRYRKIYEHKVEKAIGFEIHETDPERMLDLKFYIHPIKLKYVHELQNLYYALTGNEITQNQNPYA